MVEPILPRKKKKNKTTIISNIKFLPYKTLIQILLLNISFQVACSKRFIITWINLSKYVGNSKLKENALKNPKLTRKY
jgi:hypothetical protein